MEEPFQEDEILQQPVIDVNIDLGGTLQDDNVLVEEVDVSNIVEEEENDMGRGRSRTSYRTTPSPNVNSGSQYSSPDSTPVVQSTQFNLQSPPPPPPSQPFAPMLHQFPYPGTTMPPWGYYGVPPTFYPPDVVPPSGQYVGGTSHMPDRHSPYTFMPTPQGLNSSSAST
ncbi:uncharacterized protein LOC127811764 [Diospyros lotus]|uniref:uncharacterized protein LOC127811764 n=1 Tax=Diospyros lotus TaxID=55363 RepID=UPI00225A3CFD|nr:uncharacterized protein LOC127811764 [Diospyros lotus]